MVIWIFYLIFILFFFFVFAKGRKHISKRINYYTRHNRRVAANVFEIFGAEGEVNLNLSCRFFEHHTSLYASWSNWLLSAVRPAMFWQFESNKQTSNSKTNYRTSGGKVYKTNKCTKYNLFLGASQHRNSFKFMVNIWWWSIILHKNFL